MSDVLVTGATGSVGRNVVAGLVEAGVAVRALVRREVAVPGAETARGDLGDPASLAAAAEGTAAVFLLWPGMSAEGLDDAVTAVALGRRVVLLSALAAGEGDGGVWGAAERAVRDRTEAWTFLRAGGFATNALAWAEAVRGGGPVRLPFPAAGRSSVHERDIADVAVAALTGSGHAGRTYRLTGPQVLTLAEHVRAIGAAVGRDVPVEVQPFDEARAEIKSWAGPEAADAMLGYWASLVAHPEPVEPGVERVTGRPARPFAAWAADHRADFT
jgi:uncharacterized protein YbjT (DUF2867 family)